MSTYGFSDQGHQSGHHGFPTAVSEDATEDFPPKNRVCSKFPAVVRWIKPQGVIYTVGQWGYPWIAWAFVYAVVLLVFFIYRCTALKPLISMYASSKDGTPAVVIGTLVLGSLEDFVCATYFTCALWLFDNFRCFVSEYSKPFIGRTVVRVMGRIVNFLVSWILFVAMVIPVVADAIVVRLRDMRFTFDLVVMAIRESDNASSFDVSNSEITDATLNTISLVLSATFFAGVRIWAPWADLSTWNPSMIILPYTNSCMNNYCALAPTKTKHKQRSSVKVTHNISEDDKTLGSSPTENSELHQTHVLSSRVNAKMVKDDEDESEEHNSGKAERYVMLKISEGVESSEFETLKTTDNGDKSEDNDQSESHGSSYNDNHYENFKRFVVVFVGLVLFPVIVVAISCASSPLIAYSALNTTLNELFKHGVQPKVRQITSTLVDPNLPWVEAFIDYKTENHTLLGDDTLYRRTTGFQGELALDVQVNNNDPPNVLVIVIESFRYHDSHYLVGEQDPSNLFKSTNITITPNFDKWTKRGIALRNYWSSWRTSRSVESLLFGQLPYDSVTKSGMTGGQRNTKLSGLPQLFTAKGYETVFTTGCLTGYDSWDTFLPAHGFDTVWSRDEMKKLAESDLGIKHGDWDGPEHRGLDWGVHDDISFQLLGDLLVNKTKAQKNRVAKGEAKKPLFLNHYTISSHVDYKQRPKWYDRAEKPDFLALYEGQDYSHNIKNYLEMRYFTDMELGKFMDRMAKAGILNDTIVVITGDHGQGPEFGNDVPEDRDVSATRVGGAIVAEGRLGNAVGMIIDDATEQYDILNTLADITGVPEGGFEQDGVGRSLKRKIKFGERVVYSNNPQRKMSIVRGHLRLRYDRVSGSKLLHNADTDHDMKSDLFPELTAKEKSEWLKWRDAGRRINSYYTERWDGKCLIASEC